MVALTAATALAVIVARQKQVLEARYLELAARLDEPYVGMYVPTVRLLSLQGKTVLIGEGESQVLLVFETTCPYSLASLPAWKAVAARLGDESGVRVYGVSVDSLEPTRAYAVAHGLGFPVVTLTHPKTRALYRLQAVPRVLILDEEGRVVLTRLGAMDDGPAVDSIVAAARAMVHR